MTTGKNSQLADTLRKDIFAGKYGSEGGIPAASELASTFSLAINTVKAALTHLESEHLIVKRGQNYYANSVQIVMTQYAPPTNVRYVDGYTTNKEIRDSALLPSHIAKKIRVSHTSRFSFYREQVAGEIIGEKKLPLQISYRYYLLPLSDDDIIKMQDATFDPMWAASPINLVAHDEIVSRAATQEEIQHLDLQKNASVLSVWETISDDEGTLLMVQEIVLANRIALTFDFPFKNKPS